MRLATIGTDSGSTAVVVRGEAVAPILDEQGRAAYADVGALLRAGSTGWAQARQAMDTASFTDQGSTRFMRPVLEPGAVVCVGLNYRTHILEMGRELPQHPTYFSKLARALTDPDRDIELPDASDRVDYEGELVAVIGTGGRDIPLSDAWDAVAGLTMMNDVSMRDFQSRTLQWFAGKTWQAATPVGPVVVTLDELEPLGPREIAVRVNGELRQHSTIDDLLFDLPALVADLSRIIELRPGDLIASGTPGGVGDAMNPKRYLADGDVVEVTMDGIGTLRNTFAAQRQTTAPTSWPQVPR